MTPTNSEIQLVVLAIDEDLRRVTHQVGQLAEIVLSLAEAVNSRVTHGTALVARTDRAVADVAALAEWMDVLTRGIGRAPLTALPGPSTTGPTRASGTGRAGGHPGGASDAHH